MAQRKPTPELKQFGAELARLRQERGLNQPQLAQRLAVTRSYVGQVEAGTTRCRRDFAERCDAALGSHTALVDLWDDLLKSAGYPRWFADYPQAERTAAHLRAYETMFIYGLFQTESYMRALLEDEAAVEGRVRRQSVLRRKDPPMINVVSAETALWTCLGGAGVMREQCEHLLALSEWSNITLQIAPTGYYRGLESSFNLATQPNGDQLLHVETAVGGLTSNEQGHILHIVSAFSALQARALSADDSREFLRKAVVRWS